MSPLKELVRRQQRLIHLLRRQHSTKPPEPRAYRPTADATPANPIDKPEPPIEAPQTLASILWPFGSRKAISAPPSQAEPKDLTRGIDASRRVILGEKLPPRYRPAARRVTALICALPFALYIPYELWQRRFMGKERKRFVSEGGEQEGESGEMEKGVRSDGVD